jgi:hypothetical protein
MEFNYRVVFFKQHGCAACSAMEPIWIEAANELSEDYPELGIGFGEWDVQTDNWVFLENCGGDATPNIAVFDSGSELLGINTDGILSKSELKSFILAAIEGEN